MSINGSRPILVALALLMSSVPLASNAAYIPSTNHAAQPETRIHQVKVSRQRSVQILPHEQDPIADLILG
jgi:hypothetical protein